MNKTKQKITKAALDLFNEHGYQQVTIRMIAMQLQMSSGNLNYHFRKKEDILETIYFQMARDFDQRIADLAETEFSFGQIRNDIRTSMERMVKYKFIWTDLYSLLKINDKIYDHFSAVYIDRIEGNLFLFSQLNKMGLMRAEVIPREFEMLAERMINFGDTWIYSSEVYRRKNTEENIDHQSKAMLAMIYPYLTDKGVEEYLKAV